MTPKKPDQIISTIVEPFKLSSYATERTVMSELCPGEHIFSAPNVMCPKCRHTQPIPEGEEVSCPCGLTLENMDPILIVTGEPAS